MDPDLETVSLGNWLELPGYPFEQWKIDRERIGSFGNKVTKKKNQIRTKRARLGDVAQYYDDYVSKMGLDKNFLNGVKVVCAADVRKANKVNVSAVLSKSQSCSTSSSLSSSPSFDSPSHVVVTPTPTTTTTTTTTTADLLCSVERREDIANCRNTDDNIITSDDVFQADCETGIRPQLVLVDDLAPIRGYEMCENPQEAGSSPLKLFTIEPRLTECFPETTCCCVSDPDDCGVYCREKRKLKPDYRWCIRGRSNDGVLDVKILAKKVVLACGVGRPQTLGVPGEHYPFVHHHYFNSDSTVDENFSLREPILVVGAGLSAADAVLQALERGARVIHTFYQDCSDPGLIFHKMPPERYGEYRHVFALMQGKARNDLYTPLPKHRILEFKDGGTCKLKNSLEGKELALDVSLCFVLIGNEAELSFLPRNLTSTLGEHADRPIHPKSNPINIDPFSFQTDSMASLYALGPLVGDNFVRFVLGGALGITQAIVRSSRSNDV